MCVCACEAYRTIMDHIKPIICQNTAKLLTNYLIDPLGVPWGSATVK